MSARGHHGSQGANGETGNRNFLYRFFLALSQTKEIRKADRNEESVMKMFWESQMKFSAAIIKHKRPRQVVSRLAFWRTIVSVALIAIIACAFPSFAQIVGTAQLYIERRG